MIALPKHRMTAEEFVAWSLAQPTDTAGGRYELVDGHVVQMQSERVLHGEVKLAVALALRGAIDRSGLPCYAHGDGATVRVSPTKVYKPDGLVYCGDRLPPATIELTAPVVIVEVVSEDSVVRDHGEKLEAYFTLPSVQHYLIVDPERRAVVHHRRSGGDELIVRICRSGSLRLDPPGLEVALDGLFERA